MADPRLLVAVGTVVVVTLALATPARASHAWENYHWARTANPFAMTIVDSVTDGWDTLLPAVAADWGASSVIDTTVQPGGSGLLDRLLCLPMSGRIHACSATYGPTGWFGVATIWLNGDHITMATAQVNDFYFTGTYGNDVARRHVLCQEVGHDFGLDHHRQPSCMDDSNSTLNDPAYVDPNAHDYEQLGTIYAHLDTTSTVGVRGLGAERIVRILGETTIIQFVLRV